MGVHKIDKQMGKVDPRCWYKTYFLKNGYSRY